jgi:hypothetical protein
LFRWSRSCLADQPDPEPDGQRSRRCGSADPRVDSHSPVIVSPANQIANLAVSDLAEVKWAGPRVDSHTPVGIVPLQMIVSPTNQILNLTVRISPKWIGRSAG